MSEAMKVGVIGCGNISETYFRLAPLFRDIEIVACADLIADLAAARAKTYGITARSVPDLLAADGIDIIVNLTIPDAHFRVTKDILKAGKHAYSEKPFVLSLSEARELAVLAAQKKLRVGSAPDTFLGGAFQQARAHLDSGALGKVTSGTAMVMNHGMEHWHPNPDFFFKPGAGPMLDLGPYYVTTLVHLLGPVRRVAALTGAAFDERKILSEPRRGEMLSVETPTNIHALLEFENGAAVSVITSWDVWAHRHENLELYATEGSLYLPDPNFFGGDVTVAGSDDAGPLALFDHPFGVPNQDGHGDAKLANYRAAGLADMAQAIRQGRPHRCSLELATHVVDVMTSVLRSGDEGRFVELETSCDQPAPLTPEEARALLA